MASDSPVLSCAHAFVKADLVVPGFGLYHCRRRVVRVQVDSRSETFHGTYERITGRIYFSLPVANPPQPAGIVDLANAVNLKDGEVEFSSDFIVVRP